MGARVLVVDDDPWILRMVTATLEKKGYAVDTAREGRQALERAQAHPPDVIVTDVMMPVMDGWTLVQHLRQNPRLSAVPVIFLTALGKDEARLSEMGLTPDDYLAKPFRFDDLEKRVKKALSRAASSSSSGMWAADESGMGSGLPIESGVAHHTPPNVSFTPPPSMRVPTPPPSMHPSPPPEGFDPAPTQFGNEGPGPDSAPRPAPPQPGYGYPPGYGPYGYPGYPPHPGQYPPSSYPPQYPPYPVGGYPPYGPNAGYPGGPAPGQPPNPGPANPAPGAGPAPSERSGDEEAGPKPRRPGSGNFVAPRRSTALNGRLEQLGLSSLLVMMEMERKDGVLSLKDSDEEGNGRIFLRGGQVVSAKLDNQPDLGGRECVYQMLGWKKGTFSFNAMEVEMEDTVQSSTTHLLMEGARLIDEANRNEGL